LQLSGATEVTTEPALIVAEPAQLPQVSESAAILQVIERMAVNPAVDVEKFERLMAMHERIQAKRAETAFNADLAVMQPKLPIVSHRGEIKNREGKVVSSYAKWEDINEAVLPVLSAHGFSLTFRVGQDGAARVVTAFLRHRDGHKEETTLSLPLDTSGFKNDVQAVGSSLSYAKRYTAMALLNITTTGEDDDGQKAGTDYISEAQKDELVELLRETNSDVAKFLKFIGAASLDQIRASDFNKARSALTAKKVAAK
jgi:hypothetical protein